jgi:hypothetical protein
MRNSISAEERLAPELPGPILAAAQVMQIVSFARAAVLSVHAAFWLSAASASSVRS